MNFHDIEQNTDEWLLLRSGKITGSGISKVMANSAKLDKNENIVFGEPAKKYASQIALERLTGNYTPSAYSNEHMERGHEQEPLARAEYEDRNFINVDNGGFFGDDYLGCSPDGLIGDDGVIEIKSVIATTHFSTIKRKSFDPSYKWQLLFNLKTTGRDWIDFVSYCAEYPAKHNLFTYRLNKCEYLDEFAMLDARIKEFMGLVDECRNIIETSEYSL